MTILSLPMLPIELQLETFSYLETKDLNVLRQTSREFRILIDQNQKFLYRRRLVDINVQVWNGKITNVRFIYKNHNIAAWMEKETLNISKNMNIGVDEGNNDINEERREFVGTDIGVTTFEDFLRFFSQRNGGHRLDIGGDLDAATFYSALQPLVIDAYHVTACCKTIGIPNYVLYEAFCAPKRELFLGNSFLDGNPEFLEDRLFREAGKHRLYLGFVAHVAEEQLMVVINRKDLKEANIGFITGASVQYVKRAIQCLLKCDKVFELSFQGALNHEDVELIAQENRDEEGATITEIVNGIVNDTLELKLKLTLGKREVEIGVLPVFSSPDYTIIIEARNRCVAK